MKGSLLFAAAFVDANSPSGSFDPRPVTAGGALSGATAGAGIVATGAAGCVLSGLIACGVAGLAGFLPYSGAFGSQSRFLRDSAASWSGVRLWPLFRNGTGTFVTYTATAKA